MPGEGEKGDMNPYYREMMKAHLGPEATEEEETMWKEVFVEDLQKIIASAKNRKEADALALKWAVSEIRKLPNGDDIIGGLLANE